MDVRKALIEYDPLMDDSRINHIGEQIEKSARNEDEKVRLIVGCIKALERNARCFTVYNEFDQVTKINL